MANLIPRFIQDRFLENTFQGSLQTAALFMDISGFTPLTEKLMEQGKQGIERLEQILSAYFPPVIDAVYAQQGFITLFAGDALTALFPGDQGARRALAGARAIMDIFSHTRPPVDMAVPLSVKIGLDYGSAHWGIVGHEGHKTWYFRGPVIAGCIAAEEAAGSGRILLTPVVAEMLPGESFTRAEAFFQAAAAPAPQQVQAPDMPDIAPQVLSVFFPAAHRQALVSEIRDVVAVFLAIKGSPDHQELNDMCAAVLQLADDFGCYFDGLDFGDKGGNMLFIVGIPKAYENNARRAMDFMLAVKERFRRKVKAGMARGLVYTGIKGNALRCEYGIIGDTVNLAARLMAKARWGKLWLTEALADRVKERYQLQYKGSVPFKGKLGKINILELAGLQIEAGEHFYEGSLMGRDTEMEQARTFCRPAMAGRFAGILYVYGEPGIGKSRFLHEVCLGFGDQAQIMRLETDDIIQESLNPFVFWLNHFFQQMDARGAEKADAFADVFEEVLERLEDSDDPRAADIAQELERLESFLQALIGIGVEGTLYAEVDARARFSNTMAAIKEWVKALCLLQPVVLVFEDIHWLDADSQRIMAYLTRNLTDFPLVILASARYGKDGGKAAFTVDTDVPVQTIELGTLAKDAVAGVIKNYTNYPPSAQLIDYISANTDNNPFYIEQISLYLLENKLIALAEGRYHLTRKEVGLPSTISSVIIARIDRLSAELKETVQLASVLGRKFDRPVIHEMIAAVARLLQDLQHNMPKGFDGPTIAGLQAKRQLEPLFSEGERERMWSAVSDLEYLFRHNLLARAAYDMQLTSRLQRLHQLAAQALEKLYAAEASRYREMAHHFEQAGDREKTVEYLEKAGDWAWHNCKTSESLDCFHRLLGLLGRDSDRRRVWQKLASLYQMIGQWQKALDYLLQAQAQAEEIGEPGPRAFLLYRQGEIRFFQHAYEDALALFTQGESLCLQAGDDILHARIISGQAGVYLRIGDYDKALSHYQRALKIQEDKQATDGIIHSLTGMGNLYSNQGEYDKALSMYDRALELAKPTGNKRNLSSLMNNVAVLHFMQGNPSQALAIWRKVLAIKREIGEKPNVAVTWLNIGSALYEQGKFKEALHAYRKAKDVQTDIGDKRSLSGSLYGIANVMRSKGDKEQAIDYYQRALALRRETGEIRGQATVLNSLGCTYAESGHRAEALEYLEESLRIRRDLGDKHGLAETLTSLGLLHTRMGEPGKGFALFEEALKINGQIGNKNGMAHIYYNLGSINTEQERYHKAAESLQKALDLYQEVGNRSGTMKTLHVLGHCRLRTDQKDAAIRLLRQGLRLSRDVHGEHPGTVHSLKLLAGACKENKQLEEAKKFLLDALAMARKLSLTEQLEDIKHALRDLGAERMGS